MSVRRETTARRTFFDRSRSVRAGGNRAHRYARGRVRWLTQRPPGGKKSFRKSHNLPNDPKWGRVNTSGRLDKLLTERFEFTGGVAEKRSSEEFPDGPATLHG